jgi:autotransporter-associated beta strand protein
MTMTMTLRRFAAFLSLPVAIGLLGAPAVAAPGPSQQTLYTTTTSNTTWVGNTGRWSTSPTGPFTDTWTEYATANFANSGTYNFQRLIATGTANTGNVTLGSNVRVIFAQSSGQAMNLVSGTGGVATFTIGTDSQIDFGSIIIAPGANTGYTKNGAGSLTMTGGVIQGPVTLNGGNLVGRNGNAFGQGALTLNGGALGATTNLTSPTNRDGGLIVTNDFQIGISGSAGNASSTANMTFSGTGNSVSLGSVRRTITLGNSGSMTFGGAIAGSGGLTLTRDANGAGWFALSGSNTFTGGLTLDGVRVNASASNTALGAGDVFLGGVTGSNTILNITSAVALGNTIKFADVAGVKTLANLGSSGTLTGVVNNDDSTGSNQIGAGNGRTFTLSGGLGGSGSTDWYFGGTSGTSSLVGTVRIGTANSYTGAGNTTIANSTVKLTAGDGLATNNLTLTGTGTLDLGGNAQSIAELTGDATSKIQSTGGQGTLFVGNNDTSSIFGGSILGSGVDNVALQKIGTGSFELTNSGNTFTGGVVVQEGDLIVSASTLMGQAVDLQIADSSIEFKQSTSGTFSGVISGDGSLTKTGASTLTLSGANTYAGATTVSAGALVINGSLTSSAVTVASGATLGGSGTIGSSVSVQTGGTIAPGNSPGLLSVGTLNLLAGSTTRMEIVGVGSAAGTAGTDYDKIAITTASGLVYGGALSLDFANTATFSDGTSFDLFGFTGSATGDFTSVASTGTGSYAGLTFTGVGGVWTALLGSQTLTFSELTGLLRFDSNGAPVPEIDPSSFGSALTLLIGSLGLLERRARRRSRV